MTEDDQEKPQERVEMKDRPENRKKDLDKKMMLEPKTGMNPS